MKISFMIVSLVPLFFIGCSSTYTIKDFSSKDKFYNDFNNFAGNKSLNVTLTNDSSFVPEGKIKISDDTLIITMNIQKEVKIKKNEVKDIKYTGSDLSNMSATLILEDGTKAKVKNVSFFSDSSFNITVSENINNTLPIFKIKKISYKNHWINLPLGFLGGAILGAVIGGGVALYDTHHSDESDKDFSPIANLYAGIMIGPVCGIIVSWILGRDYIYQFNP